MEQENLLLNEAAVEEATATTGGFNVGKALITTAGIGLLAAAIVLFVRKAVLVRRADKEAENE